ncbi:hypothetical protein NUSPORA_02789 [Nucleospora cyclopteri]
MNEVELNNQLKIIGVIRNKINLIQNTRNFRYFYIIIYIDEFINKREALIKIQSIIEKEGVFNIYYLDKKYEDINWNTVIIKSEEEFYRFIKRIMMFNNIISNYY